MMEILAPAGGREQLLAAVRCGADAVYLGARGFNARRNAANFNTMGLSEAVAYCHGCGVRAHVTLNTLVADDEREALLRTLEEICQSGADAVIVQDLGVAALCRRRAPSLPLHASTQMTVHNVAGAVQAAELGFSRAILARELTLQEIRTICREAPLQVEVFVHGALCVSASGACYLSSMLGGRSGNRGLCAQPCRLDFSCRGRPYALSLKDMSHIGHVRDLAEAGVCSLKIEGRMRRPEYVAAAVTACRDALKGREVDWETLRAVFSRGGFTDGYLTGKRDVSMYGRRRREDAAPAATLGRLSALYRRERSSVPVDMTLFLLPDRPSRLEATDGRRRAQAEGPVPEAPMTVPLDRGRALSSLGRTGGTPFFLRELALQSPEGLTLPSGALNALRRDALEGLRRERARTRPHSLLPCKGAFPAHACRPSPALRLRFQTAAQWFDWPEAEAVYLPVEELAGDPGLIGRIGSRLVGELPALVFPGEEESLGQLLVGLKARGLAAVCAGDLGGVALGRTLGFAVFGGYGLNVLNTGALMQYEALGVSDLTLSPEIRLSRAAALGGSIPRGLLGYGFLPLMRMRACPARGEKGCGACDGAPEMTDRTGARFRLLCEGRRHTALLNSVPLDVGGRDMRGVDFLTLYFTVEKREACRKTAERFLRNGPPAGPHTAALYFRELL